MTDVAPARPATLRILAHKQFMEKLNTGALRPAQLVSQRELCALLDVPMGPMREALKRLEGEGIVTLIPHRGIKILDIDEKTINDAFQMRLMIEIEAVRAFARDGDIAAAAELRDRTRAAGGQGQSSESLNFGEINAMTALDHEMHRMFVAALENDFANDLFDRVLSRLQLSRLVFRLRNYTDDRAKREHLTILGFVIAGEDDRAAEAMETHLKASWRRAMGFGD